MFDLLVANSNSDSLASKIGLRFSGSWTAGGVRLIPDARSYVLPDGGHFYPHVHGAEFCRVLTSFLLES